MTAADRLWHGRLQSNEPRPHRIMRSRVLFIPCAVLVSAGTRVDAQAVWRVESTPALSIAATSPAGEPVYATATWATRLPNGNIALADGGDWTVRLFHSDGKPLRSFGRQGAGPGEFRSLGWISRCGGEQLFAWDFILARMNVIDPVRGPVSSWGGRDMRTSGMTSSCSTNGEFALAANFRRLADATPAISAATAIGGDYRVWFDTFDIQTFDAKGTAVRQVKRRHWREGLFGRLPDRRMSGFDRPLGKRTHFIFSHDLLVLADSDSGMVRTFALSGALSTEFRFAQGEAARATPSHYERAVEAMLLLAPPTAREQFGAFARSVPSPERLPRFSQVQTDPEGLLWFVVSEPDDADTRIRVFSVGGVPIAVAKIPARVTLFEVGIDYLLGGIENADGEQNVVLYRYSRGQ